MSQHTPGPWVVREFPTAIYGQTAYWVLDSIPDVDGKVVANAICQATGTNRHEVGNARLIAAAPDLLQACLAMLGTWGGQDEDVIIAARDMAKAAVEKAIGGAA